MWARHRRQRGQLHGIARATKAAWLRGVGATAYPGAHGVNAVGDVRDPETGCSSGRATPRTAAADDTGAALAAGPTTRVPPD
jgi:hypothetical protein